MGDRPGRGLPGAGRHLGHGVLGSLTTGGFDDPVGQSSRAAARAEATLGRTGNDGPARNANWWAPAPLRRFYARDGLREGDDPPPTPDLRPAPASTPTN
ncbi:hypothetical protein OG787_08360 [Streptomyces sp. NBC_00075]|uniref:hypothetical protein n=1 Tax=Streptomyces sp. NBC_00075 TaxID=2975641 RepID=UPI00324685A9